MKRTEAIAFYGVVAALAMILSYLETLIPYSFAVPGIKLGLPNLVIVFILYRRNLKGAAMISLARIVLTTLLFGNSMSFAYSLSGALLSLMMMAMMKKTGHFGVIGVSVAGGVMHNVGQIFAAMVLLGSGAIAVYLPALMISGTVAGIIIGIGGALLIQRVPKK